MSALADLDNLQGQELVNGLKRYWQRLQDSGESLYLLVNRLDDTLDKLLEALIPDTISTIAECQEAHANFKAGIAPFRTLRTKQKQYDKMLRAHMDNIANVRIYMTSHQIEVGDVSISQQIRQMEIEVSREEGRASDRYAKYPYKWLRVEDSYLYKKVLDRVEGEVKEWWEKEWSGSHVIVKNPVKREELKNVTSREFHVPAEIMSAIYAAAPVETCATLRQVNKAWYSVFQESEKIFSTKVPARHPWMRPGDGDLQNWLDCVLVFAARLKWDSTDNIDDIEPLNKAPERRTVMGTELKLNEKLPQSFKTMFAEYGRTVRVTEPMQVYHRPTEQIFTMNHWTLQAKREDDTYHVIYSGDDKNIIRKDGIDIHLPGFMKPPQDPFLWTVVVGSTSISIFVGGGGVLLLPIHSPRYEHAVVFLGTEPAYEAGDLVVVKETTSHKHHIADFHSRRMVEYAPAEDARPEALYNGLIWFSFKEKTALVPTFIDLDTPDKVYYNVNRGISGIDTELGMEQGYRAHNSAQFVVSANGDDCEIIDLVTGVITLVTCPYGWPHQTMYQIGFDDGVFKARCMSEDTSWTYREAILRTFGVFHDP